MQPPPQTDQPGDVAARYLPEEFTESERQILDKYFTNTDRPVFCLINLPEVVKGALFARYSRTSKSLRRLFLDEFVDDVEALEPESGEGSEEGDVGEERAVALYGKVFGDYGDDSVAQLGYVHLACEQVSNIMTKILEWGRLASYLEQSTRYIAYTDRNAEGQYRYHRPSHLGEVTAVYTAAMDDLFENYAAAYEAVKTHLTSEVLDSKTAEAGEEVTEEALKGAEKASIRADALDAVRGMLPAGTISNLGIVTSGQGYEQLILRLRAHPLPEARAYAELILEELRKVIPAFLTRLDRPDRGGVWVEYLTQTHTQTREEATRLEDHINQVLDHARQGDSEAGGDVRVAGEEAATLPLGSQVTLVDWDPEAEVKLTAAALYPHSRHSLPELETAVSQLTESERRQILDAYTGDRPNRRHKPGRALERVYYEFDVLSDYGAFRDLQRHRLCTIEWQALDTSWGYQIPEAVQAAGEAGRYETQMKKSQELYETLREAGYEADAQYAVCLGYRIRWRVGINARALMHLCELRTQPQGHDNYREVAAEMWRQVRDAAGHETIAAMMRHVDTSTTRLGRLEAETRAEEKRSGQSSS